MNINQAIFQAAYDASWNFLFDSPDQITNVTSSTSHNELVVEMRTGDSSYDMTEEIIVPVKHVLIKLWEMERENEVSS